MTDLDRLAAAAGASWGGFGQTPAPVAARENAVYRTALSDRTPVALRLHRPGYQDDAAIADELALCEALADAGFACPWPYRTTRGEFVGTLPGGAHRASVLQWIDGRPLATVPEKDMPLADRYAALGALLADFHLTADAVAPSLQARPGWDAARLTGAGCAWGDPVADPALTDDDRTVLLAGRDEARARLAQIGEAGRGPIHGDALADNVLLQGDVLYLIDFDDCGPGFRLYDLATALISLVGRPGFDTATAALLDGYLDAGGPLTSSALRDLPLFLMLRAQASAAWAHSRCASGDPRRAAYRARALALTRHLLED